jgi:hypothetical protein
MEKAANLGFDLVTTPAPDLYKMVLAGRFAPKALEALSPAFRDDFERAPPGRETEAVEAPLRLASHEGGAGNACLAIPLTGSSGATADFVAEPRTLYYLYFLFRREARACAEDAKWIALVLEREEPPEEVNRFRPVDEKRQPDLKSLYRHAVPVDEARAWEEDPAGEWREVRMPFRTGGRTRSLRLILGAVGMEGTLRVDRFALRILPPWKESANK